nr:hypothetical protein [Allobaculum sp. Allo2]
MNVSIKWLETPNVTQVNRKPPHASLKRSIPEHTAIQSLNGVWKGAYSEEQDVSPTLSESFVLNSTDVSDFDDVLVPAHFQTQGYGKISTPILPTHGMDRKRYRMEKSGPAIRTCAMFWTLIWMKRWPESRWISFFMAWKAPFTCG